MPSEVCHEHQRRKGAHTFSPFSGLLLPKDGTHVNLNKQAVQKHNLRVLDGSCR